MFNMTKIDLRTSGVSLHFKKHKANTSDINGLQRHNERQPGGRHGNKNIVDERTKDNIFLIEDDRKLNKRVEDTIVENRNGGLKGVRQNAVRMVEGTVQLSGKVLDQPEERQVEILKDSFEYLQDVFGKDNFVSAVIHLDETTPHLHFDFVPIEDGRLTAKTIISPNRLKKYQADFLNHLQDNYSDLNFQRGTGEYNGLSFEAFKRLKDEEKRVNKELDDREDKLDDREDALNDREDKLNEKVKTLYQDKEKELNDKEEKLKQDKFDLDEKTKTLWVDQQKLKQDKSDLADREDKVKKREDKVKKTEAEQAEKSKNLDKRDSDITQREAKAVESIQIALDGVDDEVAQRVAEATAERVKELDNEVARKVAEATVERVKELNDREHDVEGREKAVEGREKGLDDEVAQRTAERFAKATGMMTEAKRLKREADEKDKKADKKFADAEEKDNDADQNLSKINNVWNNIQQALNHIVERIKHGDLKPEEVEDTIEKYDPVTEDNVDDFMLDMNDLVDDNQLNL